MRDMKNSGIEWIGFVPKNWDIKKLKFSLQTHFGGAWGANAGQGEKDSVCIRVADFNYPHLSVDYNDNMTIRSYDNKVIENSSVIDGDILLEKSGGGEQTPVGRSVLHTGKNAMCANFIECLRPSEENDSRFLNYWLYSSYQNGYSKRNIKQTTGIQNLDVSGLLSEAISIPSIEEQKAIAEYLDKKCADIDEIISAKEKTNELLKERRQSIITEAVTKGLNPNAEMKDSGIDWIGEIPKHWDTIRLKHLGDAIIGLTYSPMDIVDDGTLVLRSSNIKDGKLVNADNVYVSKDIPEKLKTKKGDILLCSRNGSKALIGKNSVITEDFVGSSFGAFMTIFRSDYNHYLKYVFNSSLFDYYLGTFLTTTINQLTTGNLDSIVIPLPTEEDEMKEIESYIESKCGEIDKLIESNNKTIEKLQEYRKSLIYEAVTGKIEIN